LKLPVGDDSRHLGIRSSPTDHHLPKSLMA
jgi:hypothetical protein